MLETAASAARYHRTSTLKNNIKLTDQVHTRFLHLRLSSPFSQPNLVHCMSPFSSHSVISNIPTKKISIPIP